MTVTGAGGPPASRVAVCGLGVMGGGMARRLLGLGATVHVWNRTAARAAELAGLGAVVHTSPAAAATAADVVVVCVADGGALAEVVYGVDGVLAAGPGERTLLCAGTVSPAEVAELAGSHPATLDIGLLGNGQHAATGQLRMYVGGPEMLLDRVRPLLENLAKQVSHVGGAGSGMRMKLLMNLLMGVEMQAMAEAVGLAVAGGLDRGVVLDAIRVSGFASPVMSYKAQRMAEDRFDAPDFRLEYMAKDLALAVDEATASGITLAVTRAASTTHAQAVVAGLGPEDCAAIINAVAPRHPVAQR